MASNKFIHHETINARFAKGDGAGRYTVIEDEYGFYVSNADEGFIERCISLEKAIAKAQHKADLYDARMDRDMERMAGALASYYTQEDADLAKDNFLATVASRICDDLEGHALLPAKRPWDEHRPGAGTVECEYCGEKDCDYSCDESQAGGFASRTPGDDLSEAGKALAVHWAASGTLSKEVLDRLVNAIAAYDKAHNESRDVQKPRGVYGPDDTINPNELDA